MPAALAAVQRLTGAIESEDNAILSRCQLALQLATKLDDAVSDTAPASFAATAQLSKELRAVIEELSSVESKKQTLVNGFFAAEDAHAT